MTESRKDWVAAQRVGSRLGWFGGSPEADAEQVTLARPQTFDTIVATSLPEEGLEAIVEQLAEKGRLLVAVPFGAPFPSVLIHQLRSTTVPISFDLVDGELRLAVEKQKPNVSSWQMFASPGKLLSITERGAREREEQRLAEIAALRSAYERLAERLMSRAAERAGASIAVEEKVGALAEKVKVLADAPDARVGRMVLQAVKSPREAATLPLRLLRTYLETRNLPPALPPPNPIDRDVSSLLDHSRDRLALIVDGRQMDEAIGFDRELAMEGWSVVLAAKQKSTEMRAAQKIVRTQIELLAPFFPELERADALRRIAVFRTPHPIAASWINRLNAWGWITVYDCFDDWPQKLRLGMPHRYRRSVERFILHNADLICATAAAAERLRALTDRSVEVVDALADGDRCRAILEATAAIKTPDLPEKHLHPEEELAG